MVKDMKQNTITFINFNIFIMKKFYLFMLAFLAMTMNAAASTRVLYSQDFEAATDAASLGWSSTNGTVSIVSGTGKKLQFDVNASQGGNRSAQGIWGTSVFDGISETSYTLKFDYAIQAFGNKNLDEELTVMTDEETYKKTALNKNYAANSKNWLFDLTQVTTGTVGNATQSFVVNDDADGEKAQLTAGMTYTITLNVDTESRQVAYSVVNELEEEVISGTYEVPEGVDMKATGIFMLGARAASSHIIDNISLSVESDADYANKPSVGLIGISNHQRVYSIGFIEGEELYLEFNGKTFGPIDYSETTNGAYTWSNNENYDPSFTGVVSADCPAGTLVAYTKVGEAVSDKNTVEVSNDIIPVTKATFEITSVNEGFAKSYKLLADNSDIPLKPRLYLAYKFEDENHQVISSGEDLTAGTIVDVPSKGTLTVTTSAVGYGTTESVIENSIEYSLSKDYNFAHLTDNEISAAGFSSDGNVTGNYATYNRLYWYDKATYVEGAEDNSAARVFYNEIPQYTKLSSAWTDGKLIDGVEFTTTPTVNVHIMKGVGLLLEGRKGDDMSGNWIQSLSLKVNDLTDDDFIAVSGYSNYGQDALHPIVASADEFLASDNGVSKGVFKGNSQISLYRLSDCISRFVIYSPKNGSTGIKGVNTVEIATPSVKKMMTKNGLVIVKSNKVFSVAGAQIK